jgi:hypothetical protein
LVNNYRGGNIMDFIMDLDLKKIDELGGLSNVNRMLAIIDSIREETFREFIKAYLNIGLDKDKFYENFNNFINKNEYDKSPEEFKKYLIEN